MPPDYGTVRACISPIPPIPTTPVQTLCNLPLSSSSAVASWPIPHSSHPSDPMASTASPPAASELDSHLSVVWDASAEDMEVAATWFIDSTASHHMTDNLSLLTDLVPVSNKLVDAGIAKGMQVLGVGSVSTEAVVLYDVWFVPSLGLSMNLVSVDQLTADPNLIIGIAGAGCNVTKISDGSLVGSAHLRPDNKYEVDFLRIQQN